MMEYIKHTENTPTGHTICHLRSNFLYDNNRINLHNIRIIMADKKQKNTELRMRIPDGHREILEEYCRVFQPHLPQFVDTLWRICGKPSRTRVNYEKLHFSNIYSRASTKCGKQSSEPKKKGIRFFPMISILQERLHRSLDWIIS